MEALARQFGVATAAMGSTGPGTSDGGLDEVARLLHGIEDLLDELIADAEITTATARQLRLLRDQVSVHLSAAASLRLLDLDANAAVVLRRAVDAVRPHLSSFEDTEHETPVYDAS